MKLGKHIKQLTGLFFGSPQRRYETKYSVINAIADRNGFRLYNKNLAWLNDEEYARAWSQFSGAGTAIHERKFNLFNMARSICNVPGDLAECGVFSGGSSHLMLVANEDTTKHLYGFDSFEGLSAPTLLDSPLDESTFKWRKHDMQIYERTAHANLEQHLGRYTLYKGWIPDRFGEVADKKFSMVHIDVDLYEPTLAALEFFYPRVSTGGIILCDDYGFKSCPGARKAMDEFFIDKPEARVVHLTTGQGVVVRHAN